MNGTHVRLLAVGIAVAGLAGCVPASVPAPVPPAGPLPANGAWDGQYKGFASLSAGSPETCNRQIAVSDFYVTSGRVSYGEYFGTVRPDGEAVLEASGPIIVGRFGAGRFTGDVRGTTDGCAYRMEVARVSG